MDRPQPPNVPGPDNRRMCQETDVFFFEKKKRALKESTTCKYLPLLSNAAGIYKTE
jgi:hypothetical protein